MHPLNFTRLDRLNHGFSQRNFNAILNYKFDLVEGEIAPKEGTIGFWFMLSLLTMSITGIYLIWFKTKESSKLWHSIHDGTVIGIWGEVLAFLVGFLPLIFAITGIALWLLKKKKKNS